MLRLSQQGTKRDDTHCSYTMNYDLTKGNANISSTGRNRVPAVVEYTSIEHRVENNAKEVSNKPIVSASCGRLDIGRSLQPHENTTELLR